MEIPKQFDPGSFEEKHYAEWEKRGYFKAHPESNAEPFVIVIPPPNVTGVLHTGHAMFVTLQDILVRWKRMKGYDALWLPGTDHAGIATQMVVARDIEAEGGSRLEMGREAFLDRVWKWREEKGDTILRQLRRLGASCDWSKTRFTLDPAMSKAVRTAFYRLYREGLIYRGEYMINWCPSCGTALSDLEVEHSDTTGNLWYVRYLEEGGATGSGITVATTRPETMLGDTAVAVHPDDPRYSSLVGKRVVLPLMHRSIPVIADEMVDREFGTGAVKITPAHDPNDFEAGRRHGLDSIRVIGDDGRMTSEAGPFAGKDRFEARKEVVKSLDEEGLLVKITPHTHAVGHCQRCGEIVEPMVSNQWFLKIEPLAEPALKAVESGEIRIIPEHWKKVYLNWMSEIHDWCISRQLWWGHRIPAYSCTKCGRAAGSNDPDKLLVSLEELSECPYCGGPLKQDPDVLDTWFSSQLWPFSTMGWPDETETFSRYYPTSVMETGYDILFFWVARMIMAGLKFTGKVPFKEVFLHGLVRDAKGRKMSKTLGNVIDPLELIDTYGADAVRFTLAILTVPGTDVALDPKRMEGYRAFGNKLWNAARYVMMQAGDAPSSNPDDSALSLWDRWILFEYEKTVAVVGSSLEKYKFYEAADALYHFVWHRYCDWYVEVSKVGLAETVNPRRVEATRWVLHHVLDGILRLLHPFMPFITEELWLRLTKSGESLMVASYPESSSIPVFEDLEKVEALMDLVASTRNLRAGKGLPASRRLKLAVVPESSEMARVLREESLGEIKALARMEAVEIVEEPPVGEGWFRGVASRFKFALYSPGEEKNREAERDRLRKALEKAEKEKEKFEFKLSNPSFVEKAPPEIVEKQRSLLLEYEGKVEELKVAIAAIT